MEKYFGVCYYPELYPKEKQEAFIREDIENMRRARFNVVRMAEFCWCLMEPREGVYDFDWLEEIVDRLGQNGIYTVLCTPTACQPVWMARRYPETLYVDNLGVQRSYGGRHYHCYNSPVFRDFTEKICLEMSRRFGRCAPRLRRRCSVSCTRWKAATSPLPCAGKWVPTSAGPAASCGGGNWKENQRSNTIMRVCHRTHQGLVRASNQDSLLAEGRLYGVADGMGGHKGGETASRVAVQVVKNALSRKRPEEDALRMGLEAANRRIYGMAGSDENLTGMGTTMTLLWEGEQRILIGHVGDSRAYRLRDGKLSQITQDHSVVGELLRNQVITPEMAKKHPYRNIITRAVGIDPVVEVDVLSEDKQLDDLWLVCSDGLYNMVDDKDIEEILNTLNEEKAADRLLELALEHGGTDNITFVLGRVMEVQGE